MRVIKSARAPPLFDVDKLFQPTKHLVRIYCLQAIGVQPMDAGGTGKSDPYIKVPKRREAVRQTTITLLALCCDSNPTDSVGEQGD